MKMCPFGFDMPAGEFETDPYDSHIERRLSTLSGLFSIKASMKTCSGGAIPCLRGPLDGRPEQEGELSFGLSIVYRAVSETSIT